MITDLFSPKLLAQLEKLGRFFVWRRKILYANIIDEIKVADGRHYVMIRGYEDSRVRLEKLIKDYAELSVKQVNTTINLDNTTQALSDTKQSLNVANFELQTNIDANRLGLTQKINTH